jgi:uncharacterized protein (TIGR00255 family)
MAVQSMTGFARTAGVTGAFAWAWELKSVNGRGLEVRTRVPPGLDSLAEEARQRVQKALTRGQCQLTLTIGRAATPPKVRINEEVLAALVAAVERIPQANGLRPASIDGLLAVRGVVEIEEEGGDALAVLGDDLRQAADRLVEELQEARLAEGVSLAGVLEGQLQQIDEFVREAEACPARQPDAVRRRLAAQVAELTSGTTALDPDRLHQEAVLLATRADIREEIDRLKAHVAAARDLLAAGGPIGRRLDFLAQEFGREANTLCAKANDVALSRIGLALKAVVEQFREQVQNVE